MSVERKIDDLISGLDKSVAIDFLTNSQAQATVKLGEYCSNQVKRNDGKILFIKSVVDEIHGYIDKVCQLTSVMNRMERQELIKKRGIWLTEINSIMTKLNTAGTVYDTATSAVSADASKFAQRLRDAWHERYIESE